MTTNCRHCGNEIHREPGKRGRPKLYCSDECWRAWVSMQKKLQNWSNGRSRAGSCITCGEELLHNTGRCGFCIELEQDPQPMPDLNWLDKDKVPA
jgi:hypothetical protein